MRQWPLQCITVLIHAIQTGQPKSWQKTNFTNKIETVVVTNSLNNEAIKVIETKHVLSRNIQLIQSPILHPQSTNTWLSLASHFTRLIENLHAAEINNS